jgi:hypothetical protein
MFNSDKTTEGEEQQKLHRCKPRKDTPTRRSKQIEAAATRPQWEKQLATPLALANIGTINLKRFSA